LCLRLDIKTFGRGKEGGGGVDSNFNEVELFNSNNELYFKKKQTLKIYIFKNDYLLSLDFYTVYCRLPKIKPI
jgi:hypothetical protein